MQGSPGRPRKLILIIATAQIGPTSVGRIRALSEGTRLWLGRTTAKALQKLIGQFHIGTGDKFDESKLEALKAGGYVQVPHGMPHYAMTSEETVIQQHGIGPQGIVYVNPADDPRKSN